MNILPEWIKLSCERIEPVGSRVTCSPPPTDTDQDWLCLLYPTMDMGDFCMVLSDNEWDGDDSYTGSLWESFKNGENNLLITKEVSYFNAFMAATAEAKRLNLMLKEDRIALFKKMMPEKEDKQKSFKSFFDTLVNASHLSHPTTSFATAQFPQDNHPVQWPSVNASAFAAQAEQAQVGAYSSPFIWDDLFTEATGAPTQASTQGHSPFIQTNGWGTTQPPAPPVVAPSNLLMGLVGNLGNNEG